MQTLTKASFLALTLFSLLLGSSCKPTDTNTNPITPEPEVCQVSLMKQDGINSFGVEYDAQHRAIKFLYYNNGSLSQSQEFIYDSNGNIVQTLSKDAAGVSQGRSELIYNSSGKIFQTKSYNAAGTLSSETTREYDASQRVIRENNSSLSGGVLSPSSYSIYEYANSSKYPYRRVYYSSASATTGRITTYSYDSNNNLTEETQFYTTTGGTSAIPEARYLRTYDNKNTPFILLSKLGKSPLFSPGNINFEISKNNILTETTILYNNSGQETNRSISNRTYEYDSKGNSTKRTITSSSGGSSSVQTVEYHCH